MMETVGKDLFEEWMQRLMGRIDRLDGIISVLINKDASGVKYLDGERMYDNQDLCEMLRTSKRSLQRFRSEYGLKSRRISRKSYYKESDVLEFISRNMEEVVLEGEKVLKIKEGTGKKTSGRTKGNKGGKRTASR
nr:helix-turn-helix domain-containing protein [Phocaeicola massiliensis]